MENYISKEKPKLKIKPDTYSNSRKYSSSKYSYAITDLDIIYKKYDEKLVLSINNLSFKISNFYYTMKKLLYDINKILKELGKQNLYTKSLIIQNQNYFSLKELIEMITDKKNLLQNYLSITDKHLNYFITEAKNNFRQLKKLRHHNLELMNEYQEKNLIVSDNTIINKDKQNLKANLSKEYYNLDLNIYNNYGKQDFFNKISFNNFLSHEYQ